MTHRSKVYTMNDQDSKSYMKHVCVVIMSLLYFVLGILILVYTTRHIYEAEQYCHQIKESKYFDSNGTYKHNTILTKQEMDLFTRNPELFLYDKCLYQVYPFVNNDQYTCQCRAFVVDWRPKYTESLISATEDRVKYLNITQVRLLSGAMENWYMLEKFSTQGAEDSIAAAIEFNENMFKGRKMRAFSWISAHITGIDESTSLKSWSLLEYFHIENTHYIGALPSDFAELQSLKYFRSTFGGLEAFPQQLCSLRKLIILQIEWDNIVTIPHCITGLTDLQQVIINGCAYLTAFPIGLFALENLLELSLWKAPELTWDNILAFNDLNNRSEDSLEQYFDANFTWNSDTDYYLSLTPVCDEEKNELPTKFQTFLNKQNRNNGTTCNYSLPICQDEVPNFCAPHTLGDGRCDFGCNSNGCLWDFGDCVQLCFMSTLSECTWDLFKNEVCDEECDNDYCRHSTFGTSTFEQLTNSADNYNCAADLGNTSTIWIAECEESRYENIYTNEMCEIQWVADGFCDDACRTDACLDDEGDCDTGCVDDSCSLVLNAWVWIIGANPEYLLSKQEVYDFYPLAKLLLGIEIDLLNITQVTLDADLNHDEYINFREFQMIALSIYDSSDGLLHYKTDDDIYIRKQQQLNCSECVGMEHYNEMYQE